MPLLHSPLLGPLSLPKMAFSSPLPPGQRWSSSKTQVKGPHLQEALSGVPGRLQFPAHSLLGPEIPRVFLVSAAKRLVQTRAQCKSQVQVGEGIRRQVKRLQGPPCEQDRGQAPSLSRASASTSINERVSPPSWVWHSEAGWQSFRHSLGPAFAQACSPR